jgi:glycosyltransferase involved in cell wall biosynthesis
MGSAKIAFLVPPVDTISGGINVIFRHAMELADAGITVALVCSSAIQKQQIEWHPIAEYFKKHSHLLWLDYASATGEQFDLAIATWWRTFFDLWKVNASRYGYFVQSIESRFYGRERRAIRSWVDSTYELPVSYVTECKWIQSYLQKVHGHKAFLAPNGIDKQVFYPHGEAAAPRRLSGLRVLIEGSIDYGFKNVPASIRLAREARAEEVWLLTSSRVRDVAGVDRVFSQVSQLDVPAIYRSCDVLVKLSTVEGMFGPPLEMFHCGGTAIVYDVTGHDEYIVHGRNALVAGANDESTVTRFITQLQEFPTFLQSLKAGALETAAQWPDWHKSGRLFQVAIQRMLEQPTAGRSALRSYSNRIQSLALAAVQQEERCGDRLRSVEGQLSDVYRSSSWRVTRPLRITKRILTEKGYVGKGVRFVIEKMRKPLLQ